MGKGPGSAEPNPDKDSRGFHDLLRKAQEGDREAMDRVIEIFRPYMDKVAGSYADPVRPLESTADLVQDSCLRAWNKIASFEGDGTDEEIYETFRAWIAQIVRRHGMDAKRDLQRQRRSPAERILRLDVASPGISTTSGGAVQPLAREGTPSANVRASERAERVRAALAGLPDETDAAIVRMYFFERLKLTQIAERLTLPYMHVRDRYWKTMGRLEGDLRDCL